MDFQAMYENIQTQIKTKADAIASKRQEISVMEAEINKLQGAAEMLVVVSNQLSQEQAEEKPAEQEIVEAEVKPKKTSKK